MNPQDDPLLIAISRKIQSGTEISQEEVDYVKKVISLPVLKGCGGCTVCCTIQAVQELGKPYYTKCQHEGKGCSIYGNHPESCKGYSCLWNMNRMGGLEERPDKLGLLFGLVSNWDLFWIEINEVWPQDMQTVLRTHYDFILEELSLSNDRFPMGGVVYVLYGAKIGTTFNAKPPYSNETDGVGSSFRKLCGGKFTTLVHAGTTKQHQEVQAKAISYDELMGNPTKEQISYYFLFGGFDSEAKLGAAVMKYLVTPQQLELLARLGVGQSALLNGDFTGHQVAPIRAMFADWNNRLGFVGFFH